MFDSGTNDMMPHFIFCNASIYYGEFKKLKEMILKKMPEYGIQTSILTTLTMYRRDLITQEESKQAAEGKLKNDPEWEDYDGSINDDLDSFINNLQNSNELKDEKVESFFLPKLTEEELKLVEEKNQEHIMSYMDGLYGCPDVDVEEMKQSDSKDKYVHCECRRETLHLTLESNRTPSSDSPSESSSNDSRSPTRKRIKR